MQVRVSAPAPDLKPEPATATYDQGRAGPPGAGGPAWGVPAADGRAGGSAADAESPIATSAALQGLYGGTLADNLAAVEETLRAEGYLLADLSLGGDGDIHSSAPPAWHASGASFAPPLPPWGLPAGSAG